MNSSSLEQSLGYSFKDAGLLRQALTHRSFGSTHNERLEFLGDAVLSCVMAAMLVERYPEMDEGDLSRLRSNLVKQQTLYEIAQRIQLSPMLLLGDGEVKSGGSKRPSILSDCLEALLGAVFSEGGFEAAEITIRSLYQPVLDHVNPNTLGKDAKTLLQEFLQGLKLPLPAYSVVATHGAAHSQEFEVQCSIPKLEIHVLGSGATRRAAEQNAAKAAFQLAQNAASLLKSKSSRASKAKMAVKKAAKLLNLESETTTKSETAASLDSSVKSEAVFVKSDTALALNSPAGNSDLLSAA
jgi:ribonuclease III